MIKYSVFTQVLIGSLLAAFQVSPVITYPLPGDTVRGNVSITGSTAVPDFQYAILEFAYSEEQAGTWFLIAQSYEPIAGGLIGTWETLPISDGNYDLRLRVYSSNGSYLEANISDLQVRNYTPTDTATLEPETVVEMPTLTVIPPSIPTPTKTLLPINPVAMPPEKVAAGIIYGMLTVLVVLLIFSLRARMVKG